MSTWTGIENSFDVDERVRVISAPFNQKDDLPGRFGTVRGWINDGLEETRYYRVIVDGLPGEFRFLAHEIEAA